MSVWVPSLNKQVQFKPLTVKQQTDIIAGVLTSTKQQNIYAYQNIVDQIILDNCDAPEKNNLAAIDRNSILVQIRMFTMGDTMEIQGVTHNLKKHVDTYENLFIDEEMLRASIDYQDIVVHVQAPTLVHEHLVNTDVPSVFNNTIDRDAVGKVFLIELAKYITRVEFDGNTIDFTELTLKQKTQICEMLPMKLSQQVVEFVESIREIEQPFLNIVSDQDIVEIPIDSQLFDR